MLFAVWCEEKQCKKIPNRNLSKYLGNLISSFGVWLLLSAACGLLSAVRCEKKQCEKIQNRSLSKLQLYFHCLAFDFRRPPLVVCCLPFDVKKNYVEKYKTEAYQSCNSPFIIWRLTFAFSRSWFVVRRSTWKETNCKKIQNAVRCEKKKIVNKYKKPFGEKKNKL